MTALARFMHEFVGYGSFDAETWFLGPEEAGARNVTDLRRRIEVWESLGSGQVVDLFDFHQRLGVTHLFGESARIQRTWRRLIEMQLTLCGLPARSSDIRRYQSTSLGRRGGETLLGELMPLPKHSMKSWPYASLKDEIPCLATPRTYRDAVRPKRVELLRQAVSEHQPKRVIFYGTTCREAWEQVAGIELEPTEHGYAIGQRGPTCFTLVLHPNARGVTAEHFHRAVTMSARMPFSDDPLTH